MVLAMALGSLDGVLRFRAHSADSLLEAFLAGRAVSKVLLNGPKRERSRESIPREDELLEGIKAEEFDSSIFNQRASTSGKAC